MTEHEGGLIDSKHTTINKQVDESANISKEVFYTPGSNDLINVRKELCIFSFQQSKNRIEKTTNIRENDDLQAQENQIIGNLYSKASEFTLVSSHFADDRPLTCVRIANNGNNSSNNNMNNDDDINNNNIKSSIIASSSLSSNIKLWDSENLNCLALLRGHEERVVSLSWHGDSQIVNNTTSTSSLLASASADKRCNIWDCRINEENMSNKDNEYANITPLRSLIGHKGVVSGCEFHPTGKYIGIINNIYYYLYLIIIVISLI
jgi:WD40 repeat protein